MSNQQQIITLLSKEDLSQLLFDTIGQILLDQSPPSVVQDNQGPWSLKVAAERTGFSVGWFKKAIGEGLIPPQKMGAKFVVYQRDIDNAVKVLKFK